MKYEDKQIHMSSNLENATVGNMKKAVVRFKRQNLNQAKMKRPQLQGTLRALNITSVPGAPKKKSKGRQVKMVRTIKASSKRTMAERRAAAKLRRNLI
jgi:hypothetical protein